MERPTILLAGLLIFLSLGCTKTPRALSSLDTAEIKTNQIKVKQNQLVRDESFKSRTLAKSRREMDVLSAYIGLTEEKAAELAEQQGRMFRVSSRDDVGIPWTTDFRNDRVTVDIEKGVVTGGSVELPIFE